MARLPPSVVLPHGAPRHHRHHPCTHLAYTHTLTAPAVRRCTGGGGAPAGIAASLPAAPAQPVSAHLAGALCGVAVRRRKPGSPRAGPARRRVSRILAHGHWAPAALARGAWQALQSTPSLPCTSRTLCATPMHVRRCGPRRFEAWSADISATLDKEKETVCLCHHGMRSMQMAQWLVRAACGGRAAARRPPCWARRPPDWPRAVPCTGMTQQLRQPPPPALCLLRCMRGTRPDSPLPACAHSQIGQGFKNVKNVTGGIALYSQAVDPSVPQY